MIVKEINESNKENVLKELMDKVILEIVINKFVIMFKNKILCDKNGGGVIGSCVMLKLYIFGFESGGNLVGMLCKFILNL